MKRIVILGSTGSIGTSALDVIKKLGPGYRVTGLAAGSNAGKLIEQVREFKPQYVSIFDEDRALEVKQGLPGSVKFLPPGVESLTEMACLPQADLVLSSLVGAAGFVPLAAAIRAGKTIALANKEPMVMAGAALMRECAKWHARIIPVDSEPSAVFQCLGAAPENFRKTSLSVKKILLTASGGPFLNYKGNLSKVTPKQALAHPRWKMGPKITVDSATLMNKGFEAIEISAMFSMPLDKIEILIHPQSVLHSAVEFADNSVLAQLGLPDMRLPIQYAVTWPERKHCPALPADLTSIARLDFAKPDFAAFPCLELALDCARAGGTLPAALSAADEMAVGAFLSGRIKFTDIAVLNKKVVKAHGRPGPEPSISDALEADAWARAKAAELLKNAER